MCSFTRTQVRHQAEEMSSVCLEVLVKDAATPLVVVPCCSRNKDVTVLLHAWGDSSGHWALRPGFAKSGALPILMSERHFYWKTAPRRLDYHAPPLVYDFSSKRGLGLVVLSVKRGRTLAKAGLRRGMMLIEVDDMDVQDWAWVDIVALLQNVPLPVRLLFCLLPKPNVTVTIAGNDRLNRALGINLRGMAVRSTDVVGRKLGFRKNDELLELDGKPCLEELGDSALAKRTVNGFVKDMRQNTRLQKGREEMDRDFVVGVRRPTAVGSDIPGAVKKLFAMPSVFRYAPSLTIPHNAAGPIWIGVDGEELLASFVWISHGGFAISFQVHQCDFCIGIHVMDIVSLSSVPNTEHSLSTETTTDSRDAVSKDQASATTNSWNFGKQQKLGEDAAWNIPADCAVDNAVEYYGVLQLSRKVSSAYVAEGKEMLSTVIIKYLNEGDRGLFEHRVQTVVSWVHQRQGNTAFRGGVWQGASVSWESEYEEWQTFSREYMVPCKEMTEELESAAVTDASRIAPQFWSISFMAKTAIHREQLIPKLLKRAPPMTRVERYMIQVCVIQFILLICTFFFRADCQMVPKPRVCIKKKVPPWTKFVPSWSSLFANLVGVACAVPVPLVLQTLLVKAPIMEILSPKEKQLAIRVWQIKTSMAWTVILSFNGCVCYWLIVFTASMNDGVFDAMQKAASTVLLNKFVFTPFIRGFVIAAILLTSRYIPMFDFFLTCFSHLLPVAPLASTPAPPKPPPKDQKKKTQDQADEGDEGAGGGDAGD